MTRNEPDSTSLDLLLDTITNTFGGILFVLILVVLQLRVGSVLAPASGEAEPGRKLDSDEQVLRSRRENLDLLKQVAASQQRLLAQLGDKQARSRYEGLVERRIAVQDLVGKRAEELAALQQTSTELQTVRGHVDELSAAANQEQARRQQLQGELEREARRRTRTANLPTLRATDKVEFPVLVRYGRLYTPYKLLSDGLKRIPDLDDFASEGELDDTQLMTPVPYRGIPLQAGPDFDAAMRELWDEFPRQSWYVAVAVWDDSFSDFAALKDALVEREIEYRLLPTELREVIREGPTEGAFVQ